MPFERRERVPAAPEKQPDPPKLHQAPEVVAGHMKRGGPGEQPEPDTRTPEARQEPKQPVPGPETRLHRPPPAEPAPIPPPHARGKNVEQQPFERRPARHEIGREPVADS